MSRLQGSEHLTLFDCAQGPRLWLPLNDGVMGGVSSGALRFGDSNRALFEGNVSFENGGGFASVGIPDVPRDLSAFANLELRVRGDGRTYQLRLRAGVGVDDIAYRARFDTEPDRWLTMTVPLASFEATRRGRRLESAPPLPASSIRRLGFLIGDRQEGPFRLEIAWVRASGRRIASHGVGGE